jgi:C-terminal processing protease CtpA/Prc
VGDQTGGGGGLPAQTQLANGWSLRVSSSQTLDHQGLSIEEGIAPDVKIDLIDGTGRDEILDKALEILGN